MVSSSFVLNCFTLSDLFCFLNLSVWVGGEGEETKSGEEEGKSGSGRGGREKGRKGQT